MTRRSRSLDPSPAVRAGRPLGRIVACSLAAALSLGAGVGLLGMRTQDMWDAPRAAASTAPTTAMALSPALPALRRLAGMLGPDPVSGALPLTFAQSAPLRARFQTARADAAAVPVEVVAAAPALPEPSTVVADRDLGPSAVPATVTDIPLPAPRPTVLATLDAMRASPRRPVPVVATPAPATADGRTILQKLFGAADPQTPALAYAPADGNTTTRAGSYDRWTAVYDIAAHTVHLPDGTRLEAHSGLGASLDDPRSVTQRMRGATPPNVYDLTLREAPFHGVRALRLTPTAGTTFGRAGLLAHTFMLGPRGDSNGCVVFRDYQAFLRAYESGSIKRLAVVARSI